MFNPKVSIIIPVYNGSNYVAQAIDSALAQTYNNIEIIVVNDGSKDNTEEIVLGYGNKVKYLKKSNGGVSSALNLAIKEASGEYISWLSHDDMYYPNKISAQITQLSKLSNKNTVLYSNCSFIDAHNNIIKNNTHYENAKFANDIKEHPKLSLIMWFINGITLLVPKCLITEHNGFNENLRYTQDYDLWFKIFASNPIKFMPDCLAYSRFHNQQDGKVINKQHLLELYNLWKNIFNSLNSKDFKSTKINYLTTLSFFFNQSKKIPIYKYATKFCYQKILSYLPFKIYQYVYLNGETKQELRLILFNVVCIYKIKYKQ